MRTRLAVGECSCGRLQTEEYREHKIKKSDDDLTIVLERNKDVAHEIPAGEGWQNIGGIRWETDDEEQNAKKRKIEEFGFHSARTVWQQGRFQVRDKSWG